MLWMWAFAVHLRVVLAGLARHGANPKDMVLLLLSLLKDVTWSAYDVEHLVIESGFVNYGVFSIDMLFEKIQEQDLCYNVAIMLEQTILNAGAFLISHHLLVGYTNVIISSMISIMNSGNMAFEMSEFYLSLAIELDTFVPAVFDIILVAGELVTNTGSISVSGKFGFPLLMGIVRREGTNARLRNPGTICLSNASLIPQIPIQQGGCIWMSKGSWLVLDDAYEIDQETLVFCTKSRQTSTIVFQYLEKDNPLPTRFTLLAFGNFCNVKVRPARGRVKYEDEFLRFYDPEDQLRLEVKIGLDYSPTRFIFTPGSASYVRNKRS